MRASANIPDTLQRRGRPDRKLKALLYWTHGCVIVVTFEILMNFTLVFPLASIAPPSVPREVTCTVEKAKQEGDSRHTVFGHKPSLAGLFRCKTFIRDTATIVGSRWYNSRGVKPRRLSDYKIGI